MTPKAAGHLVCALLVGASGGGLASAIGLPAPWLMGPTLLVAVASLSGLRAEVPRWLRDGAFACIGLSIGSGIDGQTLDHARQWGPSLLAVPLSTVAVMLLSSVFLQRVCGLDRDSARMASSPGSMSYTLALVLEGRGHLASVLTIQSTRLFAMTAILPPLLALGTPLAPVGRVGLPLSAFAALLALSIPCGLLLSRRNVPVASLMAGMMISALAHAADWVHGVPPQLVSLPVYVVTGTVIGSRFTKITLADLRRLFPAALSAVVIALLVAAAFAWGLVQVSDLSLGQAWVALAPGGVEAMVAVALALGFDPTFVAAHHFLRIILLSVLMPLWLGRRTQA